MKKNKKQMAILMIFLMVFIFSGNLFRTNALNNIRTVDLLQILACGVLIGILLVAVVMKLKMKSNSNDDKI